MPQTDEKSSALPGFTSVDGPTGTQSPPAAILTGAGVESASVDDDDSIAPNEYNSPGESSFAGLFMRSSNPPPKRELSCIETSYGPSRTISQRVLPSFPTSATVFTPPA